MPKPDERQLQYRVCKDPTPRVRSMTPRIIGYDPAPPPDPVFLQSPTGTGRLWLW